MPRSAPLLALRSTISIDADRSSLPVEAFQNSCLRPILKFQNQLLVSLFRAQVQATDIPPKGAALENFIKLRLQKDTPLRYTLVGVVLGLFTADELDFFIQHKNELSKRILTMLVQRLGDQV
ncbi:MAG: hypothetical protein RL699_776 [Bacteroidota bacterium]|jgi:hypothetical protein